VKIWAQRLILPLGHKRWLKLMMLKTALIELLLQQVTGTREILLLLLLLLMMMVVL